MTQGPVETPCLGALMQYEQADSDGVMVLVSRQAIHETVDLCRSLQQQLAAKTEAEGRLRKAAQWALDSFANSDDEVRAFRNLRFVLHDTLTTREGGEP